MALERAAITLLLAAAAFVGGLVAAGRLNVEMMPELNFPVVTTVVAYPGASPEDVADQVTRPVERAVAGTPGLKRLQSTSAEGISIVVAELDFGRDAREAESALQASLSRIALPQNAQPPRIARVDLNDLPVVQVSLSGPMPLSELRRIASELVVPELSKVEGVYSVDLLGGEQQEVAVVLHPEKAAEKGVSFQQAAALLQANSLALPAGSVEVGGLQVPVRTLHQFRTLEEIRDMVVGVAGAMPGPPSPSGAAARTAPEASPPTAVHVVQAGEVLGALAGRYETTVAAIARANGLANPDLIYPGQELVIPGAALSEGGQAEGTALTPTLSQREREPEVQRERGSDVFGAPGPAVAPPPQAREPLPIRLEEIASVTLAPSASGGISRTNGKPSVLLMVGKTQQSNAVRVAADVRGRLDRLGEQLGQGVEIETVADESRWVERSLHGLGREGLLGMLLTVLVIFAFLWSPRGTMIAAASIPLSIALAFLAMYWQGFTLNVMTLAGLAVAVGRVVDDSIVVLENSHRHVQMGRSPAAAARIATAEVALPIAASTVTTVAVFLPLGMVGGIIGQAFHPFALTVTFALLASLLVALTVVPVLCRLLVPPRPEHAAWERDLETRDLLEDVEPTAGPAGSGNGNGNGHHRDPWLLRAYTPILRTALDHPIATLSLAALLLALSLSLIPRIPTAFLPEDEEKLLIVQVAPPPGAGRDVVSRKAAEVEDLLARTPGVLLYQTSIGDETGALASVRTALSGRGLGGATLLVRLEEKADLEARAAELRTLLAGIQGDSRISVSSQRSMGTSRMRLVVSGQNPADVERAAGMVERKLEGVSGLANLSSDRARAAEEISIQVDPSRAAELGLTTAQLATAIRGMIAGQSVGQLQGGDGNLEIRLSVPRETVDTPERLGKLPFGTPRSVPLEEIARIRQESRPAQVTRVGQRPAVDFTGDIVAADAGAVSREIRRRIESLELPPGVSMEYGGVMQQMSEGFSSMGVGQMVGVALVFLTMALFFNSLVDPLVILLSLPLAAVGALPALYFMGKPLSMSGMIGMLMLIGIVVTNAIVLLDFARRLMREGREPKRALLEAGRTRLRPILMTALTTVLALAPLAAGLEGGSIIASELAVVVMGGLLSSTFLTLLVVPAAYSLVRRPRP